MAVTWDKSMYDAAYSINAEPDGHPNTRPGIRLHYNRAVLMPEMRRRAAKFISILGITQADRILIVGCGFGWTVEAFAELGYTVVGADVSAYINNNLAIDEATDIRAAIQAVGLDPDTGEGLQHFNRLYGDGVRTRAIVLNEDSKNNRSRNAIRRELGGDPTIAISEDLVTSLTDVECASLQSDIAAYGAGINIAHYMTELANPNPPFNFNSKTLEQWKLIFPASTVIAAGSYRSL